LRIATCRFVDVLQLITMKYFRKKRSYIGFALLLSIGFQSWIGCSRPDWFVGLGGAYNEGKYELLRRVGGNMDKAVDRFEYIAKEDPTYRDSLTQLGRAYYKKARYQDAHVILQRAVALNDQDEIAWLVFGLSQLRLGDNNRGMESVRGGLTLFGKATANNSYRGYKSWDPADKVKIALRRAVFVAVKGLEQKDDLIRSVEAVLSAVDDEEFQQMFEKGVQRRMNEG
jgi:tetratricopeptide (TPR) repeat protein